MKNTFTPLSFNRLFIILFLFSINFSFAQTVYYANSSTGNDTNAGTIGAPFKTFHKAYTAAATGDIINLTGIFDWSTVDEIGDVSSTGYTISKNISIEGNNASTTMIQAANADNIADRRVFTFSLGYTVDINNCTIRFGKTSDGGGIQVDGSSTINNCDVSYNRVSGSGGGINCRGNVHIINSLVSNNFAHYMGGGINRDYYSGNGGTPGSSNTLIITNSTIAYNQVLSTLAYMEGGGVFFRRGIGTITNSIIAYNKVTNVDSSTNGLGTGDPSAVVNLKNNIIANNFRYNCWSGDIGHREPSNSGTYVDNGNNIFGVKGYWSQGLSVSSTSWLDHISDCSTPDGVFVLQNGQNCRSGQLFLATVLAQNSSLNNIKNFEITNQASIAINNGSNILNSTISIPNLDMRGLSRVGNVDIGSIEYQSEVASFLNPVAGNVSSSQLVCYNSSASDITLSGYTGSIQWQTSLNNSTWTNISGATNSTLTSTQIGTLTQTKYFRANVSNGGCTVTSNPSVSVTVNSLPLRPVTVTTINYCQGETATALTATATTGHTIKWYTVATGGTASLTAPTPITSSVGTTTYYVSQLNNSTNCESERGAITVTIYPLPLAPIASTTINYCQGATASALAATVTTGNTLQWYTVSTGGTASTIAPTPLTTTLGATIYYVSQKNNTSNCESPRTAITVNVNAIPTISGAQNMIVGGNTVQLTGSGTPDVTTPWTSSNTAVATVSSTGEVTSVGSGTTIITYTVSSGCSITTSLRVIDCAAPFGNSMSFDGVDDYVTVGDNFENLADLTQEAWVYWRGSTNAYSEIFTKDLVSAFAITSTNKLHANFGNGSTWDSGLNSTASIPLNTWTHLAITRQNGVVKMYINGQQDSATTTLASSGQNNSHRAIGAKLLGTSLYPSSAINGKIDELRFWSTVRTEAQIQASMNTELTGNESGLLAYYTFNHGIAGGNNTSVNTIVNLANSASNGTITNSDKSGTYSNLVLGVTANFSIDGATNICGNSTYQYTHPIVGGSWAVSNGATSTISNTGLLTSTTGETITISYTYTLNGCSLTDTKSVTIQTPVISGSSTTEIGNQISLTATTTPASSNAWISSNTSVALISNLGVVSGLTLGTTSITFTNTNGCLATQTITVVAGATQSPVLTSPAANTTGATTLNISYTLPEAPFAGRVKLTFTPSAGGSPIVWTMTDATSVTFSHVVGTDPLIANSTNVITGAALSFATYNLTLSYQDANGNPVAQVTNANIQTLAPPSISFSAASFQGIVNTSLVAIPTINTGGTSTYSVSPSLPSGVLISASTGVISGVPTVAISTRQYTVTATNAAGNSSATFNIFIDSDTDGDGIGNTTDLDIDGDGVPNSVEIQQGTSPTIPGARDTDGDGVPDYVEQQQGTSPTTPGAQDTDGDGVPDYVEQQQGTSPTTSGAQDTDGDGVPDYVEQQQGTSPTTPGSRDTDGDGVPDYVEQQQGTSPTTPGAQDTDGDGVPDYVEQQQGTSPTTPGDSLLDTDGDGVPDYVEQQQGTSPTTPGAQDTDGDGVPDYVEQQQGTSPTIPGSRDTDGDGVPDYVEQQQGTSPTRPGDSLLDTDGDGVPDYVEQQQGTSPTTPGAQDTDGDGVPDYIEQQQGTSPTTPGAQDTDGDGVPDYVEQQQGTSPTIPGSRDTDGDGVPDYVEQQQGTSPTTPGDSLLDTDGDGVPDYVEQQQGTSPTTPGAQDTDGDGVPDYVEQQQGTSPTTPGSRDTDGDGVPDYVEQQQGTNPTTPGAQDTDGDGVPDYVEQQQGTSPTTPGDSLLDTDGDGVPDYVEQQQGTSPTTPGAQDTDGDGVPDYVEQQQGTSPTTPGSRDTDGDGVPDYIEQQQGTSPTTPGDTLLDTDGDGVSDYVEQQQGTSPSTPGDSLLDTDGDGVPNYIELQQGTSPAIPGARDTDGDGVPDYVEQQQGTSPTTPGSRDTDGDGVPDYIEEQQGTNPNQKGDAVDTDGDGVPDYIEVQQGTSPTIPGDRLLDTDADGVPNYIEVQQGTNPRSPGARDTDGDGVPDYVEQQQGTSPTTPGSRDTDGDGVPDYIEVQQGTNPNQAGDALDTDGDGVPDYIEVQQGSNPSVVDATDSDNDGMSNYEEGYNYRNPGASLDTDRDGTPDYLDLDTDGDGILDRYDAFPLNKLEWKDTDGDGSGDNTDLDDDNDSILDTCDVDTNGDGLPDNGIDMDGDGVIDTCDTDKDGDGVNNTSDNCPEKSNPGQADRDRDGKGDLCDNVELNTMEALTPNGDGINDTWVIYNIENHPGSTVRVFNSNGTQVFYSSNYQNNWAGSYQGSSEMLPVGSYLYQIDLGGDGTIDSQGWLYITK